MAHHVTNWHFVLSVIPIMPCTNRTQTLLFPCHRNINFLPFSHAQPSEITLSIRWVLWTTQKGQVENPLLQLLFKDERILQNSGSRPIRRSCLPSSPGVIQNCYKNHHLCSLIGVLCHSPRNLCGCFSSWYEDLFRCPSSWDGLIAFRGFVLVFWILVNALNWYFLWFAGL